MDKTLTLILRIALPVPLRRLFDYLPPQQKQHCIRPGQRVQVPFGNTKKIGILIALSNHSECKAGSLRHALTILDDNPILQNQDLKLMQWLVDYYHHPPGEVYSSALPTLLRQGGAAEINPEKNYMLTDKANQIQPLTRAKRQQQLINLLQQHGSLTESQMAKWHANWRTVVKALLEKELLQTIPPKQQPNAELSTLLKQPPLVANAEQQQAINTVSAALGRFQVFLLQGVTGSGKTEVYLQLIHQALTIQRQVIVLLPEITLTPQLQKRFQNRFAVDVAIYHSGLTEKQRSIAWLRMQQGQCSILLGTRSAVFTPLQRPGLIILDEEHDASFKQQEGFRFSARDAAIVRAKFLNIPVLLGSATPSLETLHNARQGRYQELFLSARAGNAQTPELFLLDIRNQPMQEGFSAKLLKIITKVLNKQEQVLIFLNRRGFAPTLICHTCATIARCHRCDANLVMHQQIAKLRCHHCASEQPLWQQCPSCQSKELVPLGLGTERVEQLLQQQFPNHHTVRLDRDSTQRKGVLETRLKAIHQGQADIILGTQMLAKGHHFPNVTLAVILDVDSGLFSIDFHAAERLAQLLMQVAGRAGRGEKPGRVLLQTRQPQHPLLTTLVTHGYQAFAADALQERQEAQLPPYSFQALFRVLAMDTSSPQQFLQQLKLQIQKRSPSVLVMGPVAAPMAKKAGRYHYQLLLQSPKRRELQALLTTLVPSIEKIEFAKKIRWSLDVDPIDLY